MSTYKQKLAAANKRARESKENLTTAGVLAGLSSAPVASTLRAVVPPIPVVGDAGLLAGFGAIEILGSLPFRKGGIARATLLFSGANHLGDALAEVIDMMTAGGE